MRSFLPFILALVCAVADLAAAPAISEFMAPNTTTLKDGHDKYEDWIEVWNPDPASIDLAGWRLTDSAANKANPWHETNTFKTDPGATKQWCVLFEVAYQTPEVRAMVGRRLRTLMDTMLGTPGTPIPGNSTFEQRIEAVRSTMLPLPPGISLGAAYTSRTGDGSTYPFNSFLAAHRTSLFTTYGPASGFGMIPNTASAAPIIAIPTADPNPATGTQDHEYLLLVNNNAEDVDITGWMLSGGGISSHL
jgi:hypothetical protein